MGNWLCPVSKTAEINQEEKAILECKICRDKIKKYIKSLEKNATLKREKAKEALKNKNKDRARLNLRQAKMYQEQIKTADGQLEMIENQISQIETSQSQRDALSVLKQGNEVLKKLQSEVNVEKFQEIADDMDEMKEQQNEITEFFKSRGIEEDDQELDNELDKLLYSVQKEQGKVVDLPNANKESLEEEENKKEEKEEIENKKFVIES